MPRPVRIRIAAALVAIASMSLVAATSSAPFDPLEQVPPGAVAVASIGDPMALLSNSIGFLRNAGLEDVAASLSGLVDSILPSGADGLDDGSAEALFKALDPSRRIVGALYPSEGDRETAVLLFLPVRNELSEENREDLTRALTGMSGGMSESMGSDASYPGYIVIRTDDGDIPAYGEGERMRLGSLSDYPASSVAVWIDPVSGAEFLKGMPGGLDSMFPGTDDGYFDVPDAADEDWYAPLDNQPSGDEGDTFDAEPLPESPGVIDNTGIDNTGIDNTGMDSSADEEADAETDTVDAPIDNTIDNTVNNEPADEEFADDFSWDDDSYDDGMYDDGMYDDASEDPFSGELAALGEALKSGLEQIRGLEFALIVQKERAWFRAGAMISPDGDLAGMARRASAGDRSLPYLAYCESDALISAAWSAPMDWMLPALEALYGLVLPDEGLAATVMESLKASAAAAGMNGGASISLSPSEELLGAIRAGGNPGTEAVMDLLSRGLGLSVSGAMEVADRQAFRDAAAKSLEMVKDPAYAELMASSGMAFDVRRSVGVINGMPYDAYAYSFSAPEEAGVEAAAIADLLGRMLSPVYIYKNDKAFFGTGPLKDVAAAMPADGARDPLRSDKAFRALRAGAPADARALFYLSTKALARLILRAMPENEQPLGFNAGALSGFLSWFDATPTSLGFGLGLGAEDVKAIVTIAN